MPENVVIIGSGPAGWAAAIYAARANLKPLVFEGDPYNDVNRVQGTLPLGQLNLTTEVENYPGFPAGNLEAYLKTALDPDKFMYMDLTGHGISGPQLMELMRKQATNFGTRIVSKDVTKINLRTHPFQITAANRAGTEIVDNSSETVQALTVIVATGARANYLGLPSEDLYKNRGVSACAVCDGALPRFKNKPLVVVGGGDSAVEEATYLTKFASVVNLVHRRDTLRASKIMQQRALGNPKISMKWNSALHEVVGDEDSGVTGARLRNVQTGAIEEVPVSGVFLAIGHTPNTAFLEGQLALTPTGYIKWTTPARTYTSVEGVFAAGDVADDYYKQAITAAGTGCMAALDAERWLAHAHS
jgi:thioredoxin reductase (NADPH)